MNSLIHIVHIVVLLATTILPQFIIYSAAVNITEPCITVSGKTDGFGAQYSAFMSGYALSRYLNKEYCHLPITKSSIHWIPITQANLLTGLEILGNKDEEGLKCVERCKIQPHYHSEIESIGVNDVYTLQIRNELRSMYNKGVEKVDSLVIYNNKKNNLHQKNQKPLLIGKAKCKYGDLNGPHVAVHIRRGDVSNFNRNKIRYTSTHDFISIMEHVKTTILQTNHNSSPLFHIFTEKGGINNTEKLLLFGSNQKMSRRRRILIRDTESMIRTFQCMVYADYLIMSQSAFSLSAAMLTQGKCM